MKIEYNDELFDLLVNYFSNEVCKVGSYDVSSNKLNSQKRKKIIIEMSEDEINKLCNAIKERIKKQSLVSKQKDMGDK